MASAHPNTYRQPNVLLMVGVVALALMLRLLTVERFLPFTDYPDELNMYMLALDWRGAPLGEAYGAFRVSEMLGSYPPLFVWLAMGVQAVMESAANGRWIAAGEMIYSVRLFSVLFGVLTTACICDTARLQGGWFAATVAGLTWAVAVPIVEFNSLAIPDPLTYFACAGALWGAARAHYHRSFGWAFASLLFGIAAIYGKYVPIYAMLPPLLAMGWLTLRRVPGAARWWAIAGLVSAAAALTLIMTVSARPLDNNEANAARGRGADRILSISRNWNNFQTMIAPIGASALIIALVAGAARWRHWARPSPMTTTIILYLLPVIPMSALVSDTGGHAGAEIRHVMPGVIAIIILWSLLLAWLKRGTKVLQAAAIVSIGVWLIPAVVGVYALTLRFQPPHIVYQLWSWSDASLPAEGSILVPSESLIYFTWNRPWSGYDGQTNFRWLVEDPAPGATPQSYVQRGVRYYALTQADRTRLDSDAFRSFVEQLTPIKTLVPESRETGSPVTVYRMLPPESADEVVFDDRFALVGHDLTFDEQERHILLRLFWRALRTPDANYSVFIHLTAEHYGVPIVQHDGAPASARRPTVTWDDPDELLIGELVTLHIPDTLPDGEYVLRIGLYDYLTGTRLSTRGAQDAVILPLPGR